MFQGRLKLKRLIIIKVLLLTVISPVPSSCSCFQGSYMQSTPRKVQAIRLRGGEGETEINRTRCARCTSDLSLIQPQNLYHQYFDITWQISFNDFAWRKGNIACAGDNKIQLPAEKLMANLWGYLWQYRIPINCFFAHRSRFGHHLFTQSKIAQAARCGAARLK
jgi:hypothetical protein